MQQQASACLERHRSSAVWKLVQLIQLHADLWLNLPSHCALQFIRLYLHWGLGEWGGDGKRVLSHFQAPTQYCYTKMHTHSHTVQWYFLKKVSANVLKAPTTNKLSLFTYSLSTDYNLKYIIGLFSYLQVCVYRRTDTQKTIKWFPGVNQCIIHYVNDIALVIYLILQLFNYCIFHSKRVFFLLRGGSSKAKVLTMHNGS